MQIQSTDDRLTVTWSDGAAETYFFAWLKDNAPKNRGPNGQKLTQSRDVELDVRPRNLASGDDAIVVDWGDETDVYSRAYLATCCEPPMNCATLWRTRVGHRPFSYQRIASSEQALRDCLAEVRDVGFCRLTDVGRTSETVLNIVSLFGYVRETNYGRYFDVRAEVNPNNLADSSLGLPPHTDNPYRDPPPSIQVLHCLESDAEGGDTILVDGSWIAQYLRQEHPSYFDLLTSHNVTFAYVDEKTCLRSEAPIIALGAEGEVKQIRCNNRSIQPFRLDEETMLDYYRAYQAFETATNDPDHQVRFKLEPGEAIVFDNYRVLHGRTAFASAGNRRLQGCYADRDALYSKLDRLSRNAC